MKTMICFDLGGACDKKFSAGSFDEIAQQSRQHGMEMFQQGDKAHLQAMNKMQDMMKDPEAMKNWMETKRKEFDGLPSDQ